MYLIIHIMNLMGVSVFLPNIVLPKWTAEKNELERQQEIVCAELLIIY